MLSAVSFADKEAEHNTELIRVLEEAAVALQQSRPDLPAALTKLENEEKLEMQEERREKKEQEK